MMVAALDTEQVCLYLAGAVAVLWHEAEQSGCWEVCGVMSRTRWLTGYIWFHQETLGHH
jgi:hypothetical protein